MEALHPFTAQDIAVIASAGVMGLVAVFLLIVLSRQNAPARGTLGAAIVVIVVAASVQLATKFMDQYVHARGKVTVNLSPNPNSFAQLLLSDAGGSLQARPLLWLSNSDPRCNPTSGRFDVNFRDCPGFAQEFELDDLKESIFVSIEDPIRELRDRMDRLLALNKATVLTHVAAPSGVEPPAP